MIKLQGAGAGDWRKGSADIKLLLKNLYSQSPMPHTDVTFKVILIIIIFVIAISITIIVITSIISHAAHGSHLQAAEHHHRRHLNHIPHSYSSSKHLPSFMTIIFQFNNGERINAHKLILTLFSPVFEAEFFGILNQVDYHQM